MKKKISVCLGIIFAVALILVFLPSVLGTPVSAATSGRTGDCTWRLDGTVLTISGNGEMELYTSPYTVPWGTSITEVVIKDGVTGVAPYAFYNCTDLTSVTIPNSVTGIGFRAFLGCSSLSTIAIPDSVTSIGYYAFSGTKWLEHQPDGLVYAGKMVCAVKGTCPATVVLKEGTLGIAGAAFESCTSLNSIVIPDSVTSICPFAFKNCTSLTSITIPDGVPYVGSETFFGCSSLATVNIPYSVTTIYTGAFSFCTSLASIIIPNGDTTIHGRAFLECNNLSTITLGSGIASIKDGAFYDCDRLSEVWYVGSPEDKAKMTIESRLDRNDNIISATWHYLDYTCDSICNVCSAEHSVTHNYSAQDKDNAGHWMKCSICGTIDDSSREAHKYDNACDTTCNDCEIEREVPAHVYDNEKDTDCNICGALKYTPGDVDGKEGVTLDDAIYLLYHVNFSTTYPVNQPIDFNGDGREDLDDAIYLLYHVNFKDTYPLH